MTDVIMPQMGESIAEGTLTKWLKDVGAKVERDEPLFEISTDKVDAEIPSPASGLLAQVLVQAGATVPINTVVAVILSEQEAAAIRAPEAVVTPPSTPQSLPAQPPLAASAPTMPAAVSPPLPPEEAPRAPDAPMPDAPSPAPAVPSMAVPTAEDLRRVKSSPVVQRIATEHQVDLSQVRGTGISGRVTKQNILDHIEARAPEPAPAPETTRAPAAPQVPSHRAEDRVEIVPMSPVRKRIAEHMVQSRRISAHVSTVFEIDMTRVDQLRKQHRQSFEEQSGVTLTYLPFILKAAIDAIKANPILNASVDGDTIVYKREINIGLAVDLNPGLIVPVIRNADEKNLLGLARAARDLAERARSRKLRVEEVQGGTFTVTNPGVFGSLFGTPIIHQPQVGILAVGVVEKRPVVRDDAIAIRSLAYFALTFDHRLVDGADADRFMAQLKRGLQDFDETAL
jgi:pyruvate dehydrogenase E2 component (dihydrolipoamide acetyltransferase)